MWACPGSPGDCAVRRPRRPAGQAEQVRAERGRNAAGRRHVVRGVKRLSLAPAAAVLALLAACGEQTGSPPEEQPAPAGAASWTPHELAGTPAVDHPSVLESDPERGVLVAFLSDDGVLQTHVSPDGTEFTAGEPLDTGVRYAALGGAVAHDGSWWALGSGGLERAERDDELRFEPFALRSTDGLSWEVVPVTGFSAPVEISDLVVVDGTLVAAGTYRTARDPSSGGFRASVWTSDDGATWTEAALPGVVAEGESSASHLAVVDGRVLAAGRTGDAATVWISDNAGTTWQARGLDGVGGKAPYAVSGLAADAAADEGRVVVATLDDGRVARSTDAGSTWAAASGQPGPDEVEGEGFAPLWAGGGRYWTVVSAFLDVYARPELCYVDPEQGCPTGRELSGLYVSDDGDSWARVDTAGLPGGEGDVGVDELVGTPDGALVVLGRDADGEPVASTYPAGTDLPTEPEPTLPAAEITQVPRSGPEVGVRYAVPIYLHCGSEWLYLRDTPWQRVGPEWSDGSGSDGYGFATLVAPDRLEYTRADGDLLAVYELTGAQPPGCD